MNSIISLCKALNDTVSKAIPLSRYHFELLNRAPASEKLAEDLFFVQKDASNDTDPAKCLTRRDLRHKPLKSEINLLPNPAIKGFPSQKRKAITRKRTAEICSPVKLLAGVDSSSDEEIDKSASHKVTSERYNDRLVARSREHPNKATVHLASKDIWSEGSGGRLADMVDSF